MTPPSVSEAIRTALEKLDAARAAVNAAVLNHLPAEEGIRHSRLVIEADNEIDAHAESWLRAALAELERLEREIADRDGIILGLLDAAAGRVTPLAKIDREGPPKCWHGHTKRVVGCVSCVLVFDRPADGGLRT